MSISTKNEAQTTLIKKALSQAVSYPDYREMVNQLALEGRSTGPNQTEALANYTILNDRRMKRFDKTVKLSDETISNIENIDRPLILLVLTESWCGDAAPALPVMNKVAELSDVVDLNIDFNEKINYIIDFALSILREDTSNIHPVRLSDFIQELSNFRENLFEINSLNQRYSLHHLLLKIPC